ncbi:MAG: ABC transporter ATPase [Bacteroidia bacterium]|nr:ABC transporter ATPase [Bacteroidia bacterium]
MKSFAELSPLSRVWVYQCDRNLSDSETEQIRLLAAAFVSNWTAHGDMLNASADVFFNRFVVIAADESQVMASGCSIDKSVGFIKDLEKHFNINLLDRLNIAYLDQEEVKTIRMHQVSEAIENGIINPDTLIFNNLVKTINELKTLWRIPLKQSWLGAQIPGLASPNLV